MAPLVHALFLRAYLDDQEGREQRGAHKQGGLG